MFDHLKGIPSIVFLTAVIVPDALRAFAHQGKQGQTLLQCMWHRFPGFHPGVMGIEGKASCAAVRSLLTAQGNVGCKDVSSALLSTPTATSDLSDKGSLKKKATKHSPNHRTDQSIPALLPVISISSHPLSGLVAKSAAEPLESDLMKAFYSNRMKCQLDASSRGCCHD